MLLPTAPVSELAYLLFCLLPDLHYLRNINEDGTRMTYLDELNENQREAVLYNEGPQLVIAGAGSGKTRVLTYKIAYLLEQGYEPWSILALTFTNKAAREMQKRIAQQVGDRTASYLWMGTFHSVFSRILRREAASVGFTPNFTIYDAADSKNLIKTILKDMGLDEKLYKPNEVQRRISNAKNRLFTADDYAGTRAIREDDKAAKMERIADVYRIYETRCRVSDAMDFDDLLLNTYLLFKNNESVCRKYAEQFKYILVDEYQDTNYAQHCIVMQLSAVHQRVCVVGDDAQSIYSFRGANIDNILSFSKLFNDTRVYKLEQNYRSTQYIVKAANSLIEKNSRQIHKDVYSMNDEGEPLQLISAYTDIEEGELVVNRIQQLRLREQSTYDDFAILYRTNAQSRIFEEALRKRSIPYVVYGGLSFYQHKEIKDVIAYFRLAVNPHDEEALKRVINYPTRGIGATTVARLSEYAMENEMSLWTAMEAENIGQSELKSSAIARVSEFRRLIAGFIDFARANDAAATARHIISVSKVMVEYNLSTLPEDVARKENIFELLNGVQEFCVQRMEEGDDRISLTDYLSEVSLLTDQDRTGDDNEPKVTLMTVHSAKGLEFKNVFVVGMEENLFPSYMYADSLGALEEERRLFYVAITRAEKHCFLSYAKMRSKYGRMEVNKPSRFLNDIHEGFVEGELRRSADTYVRPHSTFTPPKPEPKLTRVVASAGTTGKVSDEHLALVGKQIEHDRFGVGRVLAVEGGGSDAKATVEFEESGQKQLLLKYARFRIIR